MNTAKHIVRGALIMSCVAALELYSIQSYPNYCHIFDTREKKLGWAVALAGTGLTATYYGLIKLFRHKVIKAQKNPPALSTPEVVRRDKLNGLKKIAKNWTGFLPPNLENFADEVAIDILEKRLKRHNEDLKQSKEYQYCLARPKLQLAYEFDLSRDFNLADNFSLSPNQAGLIIRYKNKYLSLGCDKGAEIRSIDGIKTCELPKEHSTEVLWSPQGELMVNQFGSFHPYDLFNRKLKNKVLEIEHDATCLSFDSTGGKLAYATRSCQDGTTYKVCIKSIDSIHEPVIITFHQPGNKEKPHKLLWSSSGNKIAVLFIDDQLWPNNLIQVFNASNGELIKSKEGIRNAVWSPTNSDVMLFTMIDMHISRLTYGSCMRIC